MLKKPWRDSVSRLHRPVGMNPHVSITPFAKLSGLDLSFSAMLSPELLVMILKAFHKSSPESLPELRLVTKQFDSIIVPITYNHITPTPKLIQCVSNNRESSVHLVAEWRVTQDICRYTRHIAIKELLDWEVVDILLRRLRELKTFTSVLRSR